MTFDSDGVPLPLGLAPWVPLPALVKLDSEGVPLPVWVCVPVPADVTASSVGKTGATGQTATVIYDDIVDLVYSVDKAYRQNAKFMMNDSTVKAIRKLKDGNGLPLWQPTLQAGEPDSLIGYPVVINNDVAAMAASAKSILFGDFKKYKVRRVKDVTLLRLVERYAEAHQVGFLAFARFDGDLLDAGTDPIKHYANPAS